MTSSPIDLEVQAVVSCHEELPDSANKLWMILDPPPQRWGHRLMTPRLPFTWVLEIKLRSSRWSKYFTKRATAKSPQSF